MKRYAFVTAVFLIGLAPWRETPRADQTIYTVEALGSLANIDNLVPAETGINASGEISGTVTDGQGNPHAVRYTDGIGWEYVPGLTAWSKANGVNKFGDIVGTQLIQGAKHAYRYNAATGVVDDILPLSGGPNSFGAAINDSGDVVGQSDLAGGLSGAFLAHVGLPAVQLPSLGGGNDNACGINNFGQIAETSVDTTGLEFAARVEADDQTILDAGTVDGTFGMSAACAIDDLGHIGGFSSSNSLNAFHAFRWNPGNPVIADAGLPSTFGNVESISGGISAGWYQLADNTTRALRYTDADGAVDLNALLPANSGWVLYQVKGINASGQMVGDGLLNGVATVFRLSPPVAKDTTPPVIAPHADVTAEATSSNGATVNYTAPTTTDNVDPNGTATCLPASGSTFALGSTLVTCNAKDAAGNAATPTTFNVVVRDTTPPVIAAHADVTAEATGPKGTSVTYNAPTTSDGVDGNGTASCAPASGSTFALGTSPVTCTAKDAAGNAATPTTFNVIVKDTTPPVIAPHADVTAEATSSNGASVVYTPPATSDAVDGAGTAVCAPASGSTFALGMTPVTCSARDAAGNVATPTTFKVVVQDTTPPVISMVYASPDTIWPPNGKMLPVSVTVTATDTVDPNPACALTKVSGSGGAAAITGQYSANVQANNGAAYVLTVTCSDLAGNMSSSSTSVSVQKTNGNGNTPRVNGSAAWSLLMRIYDQRDPHEVCRHDDRHRFEGLRRNDHRN